MQEIDRLDAITGSSLKQCRPAQFSMHFRSELPAFNVIGSGNGPNPVALKFKCKNVLSKKSPNSEASKTSYSSTWRVRHPEMHPGGLIAVPIIYDGDWSRAALISLVFVIHSKKSQRVAYSKGEVLLVDDLCEERFSILLRPRDERSTEDLKKPVTIHLLLDIWDADVKNVAIRSAMRKEFMPPPPPVAEIGDLETQLIYQRLETVQSTLDECTWLENTDFLIEVAVEKSEDTNKDPCNCDNCNTDCKFDENANLVLSMETPRPNKHKPCIQYFCHRNILAKESNVFEEMFEGEWTKDANVLRIRTISPSAVGMFLNFIYLGHLRPVDSPDAHDGDSRISFNEIIEIVSLAKRFEVERLREYCDSLLTDRYLTLDCAGEIILIAEHYELPLLGQAALSLLSWSMDEDYWETLIGHEAKHLLHQVVREARRKHMFCTVINSVSPY